jgi:hypothetical protein
MSLVLIPRFDDHFPKLRRGHGSTHTKPRFDSETGVKLRNSNPCVHDGCKGAFDVKCLMNHIDQAANIDDWKTAVKWSR